MLGTLRGIGDQEVARRLRRPGAGHGGEGPAEEPFGQRPGVADGGRAGDVARLGAAGGAQPAQAPEEVQDVGAEDAVVGVQLVDHHPAQVAPHLLPGLVESQEAGVQHVRRGDQDVRRLAADAVAHVAPGVAVVDLGGEAAGHRRQQAPQLVELVLLQGLEGEDVEGEPRGVAQEIGEDGGVVDQALARGRGRGHHDVTPRLQVADALLLVAPEPVDAGGGEDPGDTLAEVGEAAGVTRRPRRQGLAVDDAVGEGGLFEVAQVGGEVRLGRGPGRALFRAGAGEVLGG